LVSDPAGEPSRKHLGRVLALHPGFVEGLTTRKLSVREACNRSSRKEHKVKGTCMGWNVARALSSASWGTRQLPKEHDFLMVPDHHTAEYARTGLDRSGFCREYTAKVAAASGQHVSPGALTVPSGQVPAICNCDRMVAVCAVGGINWVRPETP
jgi:hypothetical protein